jgi:hypothetical protein
MDWSFSMAVTSSAILTSSSRSRSMTFIMLTEGVGRVLISEILRRSIFFSTSDALLPLWVGEASLFCCI